MIWILTLANKPALLLEALASVARQTRRDYRHIVHLDGGGWPAGTYPPAVFFNRHAAAAGPEDFVAWLSDDDVWAADYLETLAGYLDAHPEADACYGGARLVAYDPGRSSERPVMAERPALDAYTSANLPSCRIDGGQVLMRRSLLERLASPWCPEGLADCNIADGRLLNRIAMLSPIVPVVGSWVLTNRMTPLSSHWRLVNGVPQLKTGETVARIQGAA